MRLRTITGTRWPAKCADGCGSTIPASPDVKVVVDFESRPRKTWLPEHSPDAGTFGGRPKPQNPTPTPLQGGFTPAIALPVPSTSPPAHPPVAPAPPARPPEPSPPTKAAPVSSPALIAAGGASDPAPNPSAGVPWATASLTFNAGSFESARAGLADYAQPEESCEQLRARINRLVLEDLERSVRAMRDLHERLGDVQARSPPGGPGPELSWGAGACSGRERAPAFAHIS